MSDKKGGILYITDRPRPGNYFPKVLEQLRANPPKPGTVNHICIAHSDNCDLMACKGPCTCDPHIRIFRR